MRTSSETEPQAPSVQTAWGCLTTNLAMPGVGSVLAGRAFAGVLQAILALGGMALTLIFGIRFIQWYLTNWSELSQGEDPAATLLAMWLQVRWALAGMAAFGLSWIWALGTGFSIVQHAKRQEVRGGPSVAAPLE